MNCHGADGKTPSLPQAPAFETGTLKFGLSSTKPFKALATGFGLLTDKRIGHIYA